MNRKTAARIEALESQRRVLLRVIADLSAEGAIDILKAGDLRDRATGELVLAGVQHVVLHNAPAVPIPVQEIRWRQAILASIAAGEFGRDGAMPTAPDGIFMAALEHEADMAGRN